MSVSDIIGTLDMQYQLIEDIGLINKKEEYILLIWNEEKEEKLKQNDIPYINILSVI